MRGADVREVGTEPPASLADGMANVTALVLEHASPLGYRRTGLPRVRTRRRHEEEHQHATSPDHRAMASPTWHSRRSATKATWVGEGGVGGILGHGPSCLASAVGDHIACSGHENGALSFFPSRVRSVVDL